MARAKDNLTSDLIKPTEPPSKPQPAAQPPADNSDLNDGRIMAQGVGMRPGELAALDAIGAELGAALGVQAITKNALMREAVRRFIIAWRAGEITAEDLAEVFKPPAKPKAKYNPK